MRNLPVWLKALKLSDSSVGWKTTIGFGVILLLLNGVLVACTRVNKSFSIISTRTGRR